MSSYKNMIRKAAFLPALVAVFLMAFGPQILQARPDDPKDDPKAEKGKFGIVYKLEFRPDRPRYQRDMAKARPIVDQMMANRGPDNNLRDFGWKKFEDDAGRATAWIKACQKEPFDALMAGLRATSDDTDKRAQAIQKIHDGIKKVYDGKKKRWDVLLQGDDTLIKVLKGFMAKYAGIQLNKFFEWVAEGLAARNMPGGKVVSGAGKALGAIGTAVAIFQFFTAADEYIEMKLLYGDMLEMLETMAYLKVLLRQYDDLLVSQDDVLLEISRAFSSHKCQKCSGG